MQQLTTSARPISEGRKLVEDLASLLRIFRRGWRFIAVSLVICLTLAAIYVARIRPANLATARLLVLQQGGRPLTVGSSGDPFQAARADDESLSTHLMIIRSPLIVKRALASANLNGRSVTSVLEDMSVKIPDDSAKVIEIGFRSESGPEAIKIVNAIVESYNLFLQENYQRNTSKVLTLMLKARDELSKELKNLEHEYLEFRKENSDTVLDRNGQPFNPGRLDKWDTLANEAMARGLELKAQLEQGRKLLEGGADLATLTTVLGELDGLEGQPRVAPVVPQAAEAKSSMSFDRLNEELSSVDQERRMAEIFLEHLQEESASGKSVSEDDLSLAFNAEPEVIQLRSKITQAMRKLASNKRVARIGNDPSVVFAQSQVKGLNQELDDLWEQKQPELKTKLQGQGLDDSIHRAEADLIVLKAKSKALRERVEQLKPAHLRQLSLEHERLAKAHGPDHVKTKQIREKIANIDEHTSEDNGQAGQQRASSFLESIERSLESIETMRAKIQQQQSEDLAVSKKLEVAKIGEENLRNNLERQRALFNSVVDQLKQAQFVSDFGSVSAQILNPPTVTALGSRRLFILIFALGVGCVLGGGAAYIADLLDPHVRTLVELRRILDLAVLGVVPQLSRNQVESLAGEVALVSFAMPRSILAESYKSIRTNLEFLRRAKNSQVIMVTSAQSGDGKSTTASNLAISLAGAGKKVLLIDGDLRRPTQHHFHRVPRDAGFIHVLKGLVRIERAIQPTLVENLDLLVAGPDVPNPAELLASYDLAETFGELRRIYDVVLVDTSPLLAVTDPAVIAASVDGIVLVARISSTQRHDAERIKELMATLGIPVLGVVINGTTREQLGLNQGIGYGYGYGYGYGAHGAGSEPSNLNGTPASPVGLTNGVARHPPIDESH